MHEDADAETEQRPKWANNTLQDAGYLVGDPTDTRRNRSDFLEPPLAITATEMIPPKGYFLGSVLRSRVLW
jgi:hypothetical protein